MRFLLNMNVPRELATRLRAKGHECRHVGDLGMAQASDKEIVEEARRNQDIIVTHDLDYGGLVNFLGERFPSVIIFRMRNTHPDNLLARLTGAWHRIEKALEEGAVVVLGDASLRIRRSTTDRNSG
jgi:predicted nuclease of predicted toxin-antitoxin system